MSKKAKLYGVLAVAICLHFLAFCYLYDLEVEVQRFSQKGMGAFLMASDLTMAKKDKNKELAAVLEQVVVEPVECELGDRSIEAPFIAHGLEEMAVAQIEDVLDTRQETFIAVDEDLLSKLVEQPILDDIGVADPIGADLGEDLLKATEMVPGLAESCLDILEVAQGDANLIRLLDDDEHEAAEMIELMERLGHRGGLEGAAGEGGIASSQDFDLQVKVGPNSFGEGYLFELKFFPKSDVRFKRIKQNMFYVIDRSYSIARKRYEITKEVVFQALDYLRKGDTFNILIFDKGVVRLSDENLPYTSESVERARRFLEQEKHGGFFAATDLYRSLDKIVPKAVVDTEVNTAILFSDGETNLRRESQRTSIARWTEQNAGKVSLFTVAGGKGNNLPLLEVLSSLNKGALAYSSTYEEIAYIVRRLGMKINNPIGKDVVVSAVTSDEDLRVCVYPLKSRFSDLYEGFPYTLYGTVSDLKDFTIFLQGKYYDRWFDIKQKVSFADADPIDSAAQEAITVYRAHDQYIYYLQEGKSKYLAEAERLLKPFGLPVAFQ